MTTLDKLQAERARINNAIWKIERAEQSKEAQALVGSHFKYRNTYGSGDQGWWLYAKVYAVKDGCVVAHRFQTTSRKTHEIEPAYVGYSHGMGGGEWLKISASEYKKAWRALLKKLESELPA